MAKRATVPKAAPKPEPLMVNGIDLAIPAFLKRTGPRLTNEQARRLVSPAREWAPIRKLADCTPKPVAPTVVSNAALPVKVQIKGKEAGSVLLAQYPDFAAFTAQHDAKTYPVKGSAIMDGHTVVLVSAKPWAGKKVEKKEPTERKVRDFSQPDSLGKPVKRESSLGRILGLMIEGKWTLEEIIAKSGVEGGVLGADEKVIHRMRFVLFRSHGIGHSVKDGIVKAVVPSGFDKGSIFK